MRRNNFAEWMAALAAVGALIAAGFGAYTHNDKELTNRTTAVEVQQRNDGSSLKRIEDKVDRLDEKVERLLQNRR